MFADYYTFLEVDQQVLVFKIGDTEVAVELKYVKKVDLVEELMPLPRSPAGVEGIVRIDDEPYPLLRLEDLLSQSYQPSEVLIAVLLNAVDSLFALHLPSLPYAIEKKEGESVDHSFIPSEWVTSNVSTHSGSVPLLDPRSIWNSLGVDK